MPAVSESQQRLFGMVHAYQKGKLKRAPKKIRDIAEHISEEDAEHFAKTKHKGLPEKKAAYAAYIDGFMSKLAEAGLLEKKAAMRTSQLASLARMLAGIPRRAGTPLDWLAHTQRRLQGWLAKSRGERLQKILGPEISMPEFMAENPYNGFTVYKGHVYKPFQHGNFGDELLFSSGRPTVAVDYHLRPTGMSSGTGLPMVATGDVRRSPTFRNGDRFFTPQSASVYLDDQIEAARRGLGTQGYYRTGYHHSSDVPDFEITLPRDEYASIMDKYYVMSPTKELGFVPFGRYSESYIKPETFKDMPFSFRRVLDPKEFGTIQERLPADLREALAGVPVTRNATSVPGGYSYTQGGRNVTVTNVPLPPGSSSTPKWTPPWASPQRTWRFNMSNQIASQMANPNLNNARGVLAKAFSLAEADPTGLVALSTILRFPSIIANMQVPRNIQPSVQRLLNHYFGLNLPIKFR